MQKGLLGLGFLWIIMTTIACEKVSDDLVYDLTPRIELVEVSQDTLVAFSDQLSIKIKYEDGDGDLGNPDPDINSIFVKDSRLENEDEYYLGPLAPEDSELSISGTLNIKLASTFLLGNASEETTEFTIYLRDRSGNQSNTIKTSTITILRQ